MTTWGELHVGDAVRGADQRVWTVTAVHPGVVWLGSGQRDVLVHLTLGGRAVEVRRPVGEPVELVSRADHTAEGAAFAALAGAGLNPTIIEETTLPADPFSAPSAPAAKVKTDRWNRYLLPDPETGKERAWTRATTVARTLADEYNLTRWKLRQVAKGMALRPDLVAGAAAADPDADKGTLDGIAEKAMERAGSSAGATLGTALHAFAARLDAGEAFARLDAPDALHADLCEYIDTMKRHRLRPEYVERLVVVPALGVAGTLDRIVRQPPGEAKAAPLAVLDLKTAKSIDFSMLEIAIQLAIYANASLMWDPARQAYDPMPADVDKTRALVLHLPVGKAHGQIYGVNIIDGARYAGLAMQVREARSAGKGMCWLVDPEPADLALHRVARAADRGELARLWDQLHPQGLWTEEIGAAAMARLAEIKAQEEITQTRLEEATWD